MEQKVEVSASEMLDALNKEGFIMLHDILFETGKDAIQPELEPLLAEVVTLLTDNPASRCPSRDTPTTWARPRPTSSRPRGAPTA